MYRALLPTALSLTLIAQLTAQSAVAAGGDSQLDFVAAEPSSYDAQTTELLHDFEQGIALADIVNVQINYGVGDTGIVDDGGSMATLLLETLSGPGVSSNPPSLGRRFVKMEYGYISVNGMSLLPLLQRIRNFTDAEFKDW